MGKSHTRDYTRILGGRYSCLYSTEAGSGHSTAVGMIGQHYLYGKVKGRGAARHRQRPRTCACCSTMHRYLELGGAAANHSPIAPRGAAPPQRDWC
jgi:hypothetical protein